MKTSNSSLLVSCEVNPPVTDEIHKKELLWELWCFFCCQPQQAIERGVKLQVISNSIAPMWYHCNVLILLHGSGSENCVSSYSTTLQTGYQRKLLLIPTYSLVLMSHGIGKIQYAPKTAFVDWHIHCRVVWNAWMNYEWQLATFYCQHDKVTGLSPEIYQADQ